MLPLLYSLLLSDPGRTGKAGPMLHSFPWVTSFQENELVLCHPQKETNEFFFCIIMNSWIGHVWWVAVIYKYYFFWSSPCPIPSSHASKSFFRAVLESFWYNPSCPWEVPCFLYDKMYQIHLGHFLLQTWNQLFSKAFYLKLKKKKNREMVFHEHYPGARVACTLLLFWLQRNRFYDTHPSARNQEDSTLCSYW